MGEVTIRCDNLIGELAWHVPRVIKDKPCELWRRCLGRNYNFLKIGSNPLLSTLYTRR